MKVCAACHEDLPKDSYSKKQWKVDKCQRRCKVCITNNREVQLKQPNHQNNNDTNTDEIEIIKSLDSMYLEEVEKISDEELFKQPPPDEDCPICFLRMPILNPTGSKYMTCCGKVICSGCCYAPVYDNQGNQVDNEKCPFCRTPKPVGKKDAVERLKKRVEKDDPIAIYSLGMYYRDGMYGYPQNHTKALELYERASELDNALAYCNIGYAYNNGKGVEVDKKKAQYYYELAAMKGCMYSRHNLGLQEENSGNMDRALKHYMLAVGSGHSESLKEIKDMYSKGKATREDYTKALQLFQEYLGEIKSPQRDEAAAFSEECRYY